MARKRLGEILVQAGVLSESQLRAALGEQRRWGGPLGRILVDMKLVNEDAMVQALSHQLNFPTVNLDQRKIEMSVLDLVSADLADQHAVVPFNVQGKFLDVAMSDPTNLGIIDELRIRTRMNVRPYLAGPKMIERAVARYYGRGMATLHFGAEAPVIDPLAPPAPAGVPTVPVQIGASTSSPMRSAEIAALQERVQHLEALVARDEDVLRKLLGLFIEKGIATREEILERIK
jgi:type IV pilus assembly protein PilB